MNENVIPHLRRTNNLFEIGYSVVQYGISMVPGSDVRWRSNIWVSTPRNFFAFAARPTKRKIWFSIRGWRSAFDVLPELPLYIGRAGSYSEFEITDASQLLAASYYLRQAFEFCKAGRRRRRAPQVFSVSGVFRSALFGDGRQVAPLPS
jgi:hypothetical protein